MKNSEYININKVAEAKGLKSNRSIRLELNKPVSKYISREIKVNGGTSYEILFSILEPELQKIFNHSSSQIILRYIGIEQYQIDYGYHWEFTSE